MTQLAEQTVAPPTSEPDLVAAVRRVLESSPEPLTLSKIRSALPANFRSLSLEALAEALQRQVAANLLVQYPRYRSPQDRFWDRPMRVHIAYLLQTALREQPLAVSELRRKLPDYAKTQAEEVLQEEVAQARIHRHPPTTSRSGPRFGVEPPDPREFLRGELSLLFGRLGRLGFSEAQLRQAALEILHDEEWAPTPPAPEPQRPPRASQGQPATPPTTPAGAPGEAVAEEERTSPAGEPGGTAPEASGTAAGQPATPQRPS
jgi:hypothetical protein